MKKTTNLFDIGDCIAIPGSAKKNYGLILWEITETIEYISYSFLLAGQIFQKTPSFKAFSQAGLLGRQIPCHALSAERTNGSHLNTTNFSFGFDSINIRDNNLRTMRPAMTVLGNISFSASSFPAAVSISVASSPEEVTSYIDHLLAALGTSSGNTSTIEQEVFPIENILGTDTDSAPKAIRQQWILSKKNAHPHAREIMCEDFYWSEIEEFGPFGNDAGQDALYRFQQWRQSHQDKDPAAYIRIMEHQWGFPFPHLHHTDPTTEAFPELQEKEMFLTSIDQSIIGLTFAQLLLEGTVAESLREVGRYALQRLIKELADREENWAKEDLKKLEGMMEILGASRLV